MPLLVAAISAVCLACAGAVSAAPADEPTPTPTPTPIPSPADSPTPSPQPSPSDSPTATPSPSPTDNPKPSPSPPDTPTAGPPQIVVTRGNYAPNPADTIRTYAPSGPGPYPAVLFIHGGAWGRSRPNSYEFHFAQRLAERHSWVVAVIGYPTKIPHERTVEPRAIRIALTHLAARSDVYQHAIALWGESSGGQLALLAAYRDAMRPDPIVRGVVSVSGPTNMLTEFNSLAETALGAVLRFEGLTPRAAHARGSARYVRTSPVSIVRPGDPPTFQAISWHDPLVPPVQVTELSRLLAAARVPHVTVHLRGAGHSTTIEAERPIGSHHTVQYLAEAFLSEVFAGAL